jgi:hypothetical protein
MLEVLTCISRAMLTCSNDISQPDFVDYCTFAYKKKKKRTRTLDEDPQLDESL